MKSSARLLNRFVPKQVCFLLIIIGLLMVAPASVSAQKASDSLQKVHDSIAQQRASDSVMVKKKHPYPNPTKAMIYSAVLPGLGQFYNKKYWKIPIVYAGVGVFTYFIIFNQQWYNTFKNAYNTRVTGGIDQYYNIYSENDLLTAEQYYHRNRDLSVIGAAFFYLLNIVDANVDAQLHSFDVSDDLSFHFTPNLVPNAAYTGFSLAPGFSLVKRF